MKNTILTIASVAALAVSANAQVVGTQHLDFSGFTGTGTLASPEIFTFTDSLGGTINAAIVTTANGFTPGLSANGDLIYSGSNNPSQRAVYRLQITGENVASYEVVSPGLLANDSVAFSQATAISNHILSNGADGIAPILTTTANAIFYDGTGLFSEGAPFDSVSTVYNPGVSNVSYNANFGTSAEGFAVFVNVVPEPSSTALLGLGALGLLVRRKR